MKETITFFLPSLEAGGAERNVVNILKNINRDHYAVTLVLADKKGAFLEQIPLEIPIVGLRAKSLVSIFYALRRYFATEKPDVFISSFERFSAVSILARKFSRVKTKCIIIEHTTPSSLYKTTKKMSHKIVAYFFLRPLLSFFYKKADAIICVSRAVKDDLLQYVKSPNLLSIIYNPVVVEELSRLSKEEIDQEWLQNMQTPVIIAVGRLVPAKDYPTLLKAFSLVLQKTPAHLVIVGEGGEQQALEKLSKTFAIDQQVHFLGFQKNPYKYMLRANLFVSTSKREGFSNAIVEAMALGVPVIAAKAAGPVEIIDHGKNGLLVPIGDAPMLSEKITAVLRDKSLAETLSTEGKKRGEFFSAEKSVAEYEKVFDTLLSYKAHG